MSKILCLSQHSGQIDRRIVAEINTLAASGRDVTLVSTPTIIPAACFDKRVRVIMHTAHGLRPQGQDLLKRLLKRVLQQLPLPWRDVARALWRRLRSVSQAPASAYFTEVTPRERYDAIHCHDLDTLPAAIEVRTTITPQAKLIYDSHELFPFQFPSGTASQKYWSHIEDTHIRQPDLVITVNESIAQELGRLYNIKPPEVIYNSYGTHGNLTPLDEEEFLAHFRARPGGFRIMFQGGFIQEKNLKSLVYAFQQLDTSTQLFLLGEGPIESQLKALCRTLRLENVFFGRWVPQAELLRYIHHADLGVIPYSGSEILNNLYCTPNKLFEFIEAEIPICANDLPELRRIIPEHGIGDVYPMEDATAIASAIEACRTRCLKGDFNPSALRAARDKFSWARQGEKLLELYGRLGV